MTLALFGGPCWRLGTWPLMMISGSLGCELFRRCWHALSLARRDRPCRPLHRSCVLFALQRLGTRDFEPARR